MWFIQRCLVDKHGSLRRQTINDRSSVIPAKAVYDIDDHVKISRSLEGSKGVATGPASGTKLVPSLSSSRGPHDNNENGIQIFQPRARSHRTKLNNFHEQRNQLFESRLSMEMSRRTRNDNRHISKTLAWPEMGLHFVNGTTTRINLIRHQSR